ncbi:dihydrolipoamide acetyltransferase family protein [Subtercola sp. Z020]|uniref:dihydrolipoamide acetyltransferase family protein n=1 Tax=Subtercola sp. Z020 TaxID=2080582 RepID=UPI0018ECD541|nr:dihydrolipoamide acetyltransferase family protein [Subtercola sp. Z020]
MPTIVRMPEVLANATEAALQGWLAEVGDDIALGQPLAELETEKAMVEYNAETAGTLVRMLIGPGDSVDVGAPIAVIAAPGETDSDIDALLVSVGIGSAPGAAATAPDAAADAALAGASAAGATAASAAVETAAPADETAAAHGGRLFASPIVRRMAKEQGIDLAGVSGSGPDGRIVRRDLDGLDAAPATSASAASADASSASVADFSGVADSAPAEGEPDSGPVSVGSESATPAADDETPAVPATAVAASGAGPSGQSAPAEAAPAAPAKAAPAPAAPGGTELVPHTGMRRAIARRLTESKQTVPHFYLVADCRVDALMELRASVNASAPRKVSLNDFIVKAVAGAFGEVPEANATWGDDGTTRYAHVDIAVAVATPGGLLTPVVRGVDQLSVTGVSERIAELAGRAREGRLRQNELEGGSFSVSNLGMYGVQEFSAIINPPQSAILAVGVARQQPVVENGELAVGTVMTVTLSADHRVIDGALAGQWLAAFVKRIENPLTILI